MSKLEAIQLKHRNAWYFLLALSLATTTWAAGRPTRAPHPAGAEPPPPLNVFDRELVTSTPRASSIVRYNRLVAPAQNSTRRFAGPTLAFVTPWHRAGYELAEHLASSLDYVSPAWLTVELTGDDVRIRGRAKVDRRWAQALGAGGARVLPRLSFTELPGASLTQLLSTRTLWRSLAAALVAELTAPGESVLHGVLLDFGARSLRMDHAAFVNLVAELSAAARAAGFATVALALAPKRVTAPGALIAQPAERVTAADVSELAPHVDLFCLMTYDYSGPTTPGPVAPLDWVEASVRAITPPAPFAPGRVLMGLNFYGMRYRAGAGEALAREAYIDALKSTRPELEWDAAAGEHVIRLGTAESIYFPSLFSVEQRLALARRLGCGIAIWELGQGLAYFADLLQS